MQCHTVLYKTVNAATGFATMHIQCEAIVVAVRGHGEHGAVARVLTPDDGLIAGYVRGGHSRRLRPVLMPGNIVTADLRARSETQLAALTVELVQGRAALLDNPLSAAALDWVTALAATALPEGQPYPGIHAALDGLLSAIEAAPSARGWVPALIGFEQVVITALGYGAIASPVAAVPLEALRLSGMRIARDVLTDRRARVLDARERLVERLARALS